jgi:hypothetical protein
LRQYINGRHKYEKAKANGKVNIGRKERRITATPSPSNDRIAQASPAVSSDNSGYGSEDEEWAGFCGAGHETDMMFGGGNDEDVDSA